MKSDAFVLFGGLRSELDSIFVELLVGEGLTVLVVDTPSATQHSAKLPAHHLLVDPSDLAAMFVGLSAWQRRFHVVGLYNATELFVEMAALVGDYLGLPGPGLRAARVCRNKLLQRVYCAEHGPPFVSFAVPTGKELPRAVTEFAHYPAILKPVGRRGGSGVVAVGSAAEVAEQLHHYAAEEILLLERRVFGRDFSVEALVQGGRVIFESVTEEHEDPKGRPNLEMGYTMPARLSAEAHARAYAKNREVVARLDLRDGILHAEYKLGEDGGVYLIEMAARNPGDGLLAMYHLSTGQPMERAILDIALGRPASYPAPRRPVRQLYLECEAGTLRAASARGFAATAHHPGDPGSRRAAYPAQFDAAAPGELRELRMDKRRGEQIGALVQADDRVGSVIFDAPTLGELDALEARVLAGVQLTVS